MKHVCSEDCAEHVNDTKVAFFLNKELKNKTYVLIFEDSDGVDGKLMITNANPKKSDAFLRRYVETHHFVD